MIMNLHYLSTRFPIGSFGSQPSSNLTITPPEKPGLNGAISKLPPEILQSIALHLPLRDIVRLAILGKELYCCLLGTPGARDFLAKAYMRTQARWCLPFGEMELKWWNERNGDSTLGWDYLRQCWSESHSMRNRRRIWRAAESIEQECEIEGVGFAS